MTAEGDGYVYCFACAGRVKIGRSIHPKKRGRQFQTPERPELLAVIASQCPAAIEKHLHAKFAPWRRFGEWFDLSEDQLRRLRVEDGYRIVWLVADGEYREEASFTADDFRGAIN